ncbi:excinuclease ABC subunit C [Cytobacillus kochii]|uniref:excinuclease ABC subunit C n=1 Tax=Cytobacillus kochii TaxID=859143 RepID=UPI0020415AD1|nr:excinuclease ABC subunit C [Cytobacillus kochii]MCM3325041.1 excinuclease ABC subunit C [Cytobacillus kochii]MCM3347422.1 excinuclease ABC subunit C [Cytobacillus kochii]
MDNVVKKIDNIRNKVKQLIQKNLNREVTPETKHNISGIYMIYIDNFSSEKIVPIYIGQAKDIQRRYKQHFSEILVLNRLSYDEYNKYFFSKSTSFYEGHFKACKIFKYIIENNCTLQDFHMVILEEVEEENLDEKEQEYFQRLLPSFFGFNQLNSYLKRVKFRFSNSQMSNSEIDDYLGLLLEDVNGINSYYKYGFTRFNFEHSLPRDITYLLEEKEKDKLNSDILLKYDEVKIKLNELCKRYIIDFEEMQRFGEKKNKLYKVYKIAKDEYNQALDLLKIDISQKLEELKIYSEEAITNFIYSIKYENNPEYRELFYTYLKSKKCDLNFYEIFGEPIKNVNKKLEDKNNKDVPYQEVLDLYLKREDEMRPKRYKLIFPSCQFESFSLGDRSKNYSIKINEDNDLLNTCHIQINISNNGVNRSIEVDKEPFIIRFDYSFIDNEGNKTEHEYYIDNETTRNCQSGIQYFEKDFYNMFAFKKEKFKISSLINNEIDNSYISIQAEYKHGINDYTLKDKKLIKLSVVLDEIKQMTDEETRFNIDASESANCLKKCIINERLQNKQFVEQILLTKKLLKLKKRKKTRIKKAKEIVNKSVLAENNKVKRAEVYKQKVLIKSDSAVKVLNYVSSREKVTAQCTSCGYEWKIRSDHLLSRPYCPSCRKNY